MDALMREVPSCSAMVRPLANPHIYLTAVPIKTVREMDGFLARSGRLMRIRA